jgi:hypothetical protein
MATARQRAAARRNIKKAQTRTALGKEGAKAAKRKRSIRGS